MSPDPYLVTAKGETINGSYVDLWLPFYYPWSAFYLRKVRIISLANRGTVSVQGLLGIGREEVEFFLFNDLSVDTALEKMSNTQVSISALEVSATT